jgi:acyl-CoA thioesterase
MDRSARYHKLRLTPVCHHNPIKNETSMISAEHPFDQAIRLVAQSNDEFSGQFTPAYANMVGPFGGVIAAVMLNSVLQSPQRLGEPVALTVNFAGPISSEPFTLKARAARTNRSTQHWTVELSQNGEVAVTATAMLAVRRESWSAQELQCPTVPPVDEVSTATPIDFAAWTHSYQMRFIDGLLTFQAEDKSDSSQTRLWVRDEPARPLDFQSLSALADVFFPRVFLRTQAPCPAGTVSMTTYFHVSSQQLAAYANQHLLACARANQLCNGFADQTAELWGSDGQLLVTSQQLVYFKC